MGQDIIEFNKVVESRKTNIMFSIICIICMYYVSTPLSVFA